MKKRQRKVRLIRAAIQLVFFIVAPALFSTAFAGVKSIFQAIAAGQPVTWNSFLDVTGALLLITVLFGRHFCGYACAFGSLGDAMYELTLFIRQKVFHKKGRHGYPEKVVRCLQKVKYILLAFILLSIFTGWYANLQGMSPWDVFSMLTARKLPNALPNAVSAKNAALHILILTEIPLFPVNVSAVMRARQPARVRISRSDRRWRN